jgi:hypothetical protein
MRVPCPRDGSAGTIDLSRDLDARYPMPDGTPDPLPDVTADEPRPIENPPEILWGENRSLLLTLRHVQRVLRTDPDLADDLLSVAYLDARQIIEDADQVVDAVRGRPSALRRAVSALAESIEGELEGDDASDEAALAEDEASPEDGAV